MKTTSLTEPMHAALADHLAGDFATATLILKDGRMLVLIGVGPFGRSIAGDLFGDEPCTFDPADLREITLTVLDPQMMAASELAELGLADCL